MARSNRKPQLRRSKFAAVRVEIDGRKFASKAEGRRYEMLREMEDRGEITELTCQTPFAVLINGIKVTTYLADFTYYKPTCPGGTFDWLIEDVKGFVTDVYKLKKKLVEAYFGVTITEIRMGKNGPLPPRGPDRRSRPPTKRGK